MRARVEHVDKVTGVTSLRPKPGTERSGRLVAHVRPSKKAAPVPVEVDPEEIIEGDASYAVDPGLADELRGRAKAAAASGAKRKAEKQRARRRLAATYRSAGEAAKTFYDENRRFFDDAVEADPHDYVRDWLLNIDVRRGRGWKRLGDTAKGRELLDGFKGGRRKGQSVVDVLRWIFSQNRSRKWSEVPWDMVRSFEEALRETYDGPESVAYPSSSGETNAEELEILEDVDPDEAQRRATAANIDRLDEDLADLRKAFRANRKCLDPTDAKVVSRRIRELAALVKDSERISNAVLCQPEGLSRLCSYPAVWAEIDRLRRACEQGPDGELALPWENPVKVGAVARQRHPHDWKAPVPTTARERAMKAPKTMKVRPRKLDRKAKKKKATKRKAAKKTTRTTTRRTTRRTSNPGTVLTRGPIPLSDMRTTDLDKTKIIEARTRTHTYSWPKGRPMLWDPTRKALVWFQGAGEKRVGSNPTAGGATKRIHDAWSWRGREATKDVEFVVPSLSGDWHDLGRLEALAYRSPKDGGRPEDYEHAVTSTPKLYRFGGAQPPWVWVAKGGRLNVTSRGIVG